jgi:hypothetical protein
VADIDAKVAAVKADIATAQRHRARAELDYQVAWAAAQAAAKDLKDEFGVRSPEQARQFLAELEAELDAECIRVREALARSGQGEQQ